MELILALKKFATEILQYWKQLLAIIIIAVLMYGSYNLGASEKTKFYEEQIKIAREADEKAHAQFEKDAQFIAEQYEAWRSSHPKIKEVFVYVDPDLDSLCSISNGFVRVHDAAASGKQIGSPSESDGATSDVKISHVAQIVADNYEVCLNEMKKLDSVQSIVKKYQESQK